MSPLYMKLLLIGGLPHERMHYFIFRMSAKPHLKKY